jgi:hypothetical protein
MSMRLPGFWIELVLQSQRKRPESLLRLTHTGGAFAWTENYIYRGRRLLATGVSATEPTINLGDVQ